MAFKIAVLIVAVCVQGLTAQSLQDLFKGVNMESMVDAAMSGQWDKVEEGITHMGPLRNYFNINEAEMKDKFQKAMADPRVMQQLNAIKTQGMNGIPEQLRNIKPEDLQTALSGARDQLNNARPALINAAANMQPHIARFAQAAQSNQGFQFPSLQQWGRQ